MRQNCPIIFHKPPFLFFSFKLLAQLLQQQLVDLMHDDRTPRQFISRNHICRSSIAGAGQLDTTGAGSDIDIIAIACGYGRLAGQRVGEILPTKDMVLDNGCKHIQVQRIDIGETIISKSTVDRCKQSVPSIGSQRSAQPGARKRFRKKERLVSADNNWLSEADGKRR